MHSQSRFRAAVRETDALRTSEDGEDDLAATPGAAETLEPRDEIPPETGALEFARDAELVSACESFNASGEVRLWGTTRDDAQVDDWLVDAVLVWLGVEAPHEVALDG